MKHLLLMTTKASVSSVQFSRSVVSDSLWPHESRHARPPCPSPSPGVHSISCPLSQWCHLAISSSVVPFSSCPQSLPASKFFPLWCGKSCECGQGYWTLFQGKNGYIGTKPKPAKVLSDIPTLSNPMDCNLPGSSFHGIIQARVLECSANAFSDYWYLAPISGSLLLWDNIHLYCWVFCDFHSLGKGIFTNARNTPKD